MSYPLIRQLEEKNVAQEIDIMLWSDRMDLVAFSNIKGEVALHRLTWTRAWSLPPNKDGNLVNGMAWRPDGKVLAVAYSSGEILLINVENKNVLHSIETKTEISCLTWIKEKNVSKTGKKLLEEVEDQKTYTQYVDYSSKFLSNPASTACSFTSTPSQDDDADTNFFQNQSDFNILVVGTADGRIQFFVFGCFSCATVDLSKELGTPCRVQEVYLSENLDRTFATVKDTSGMSKLVILDTELFETRRKELFCVALKHQQLRTLTNYVWGTIGVIKETWESILLEMDSKLSKYAAKIEPGTLSADFLDLLMFGICSDEMQEFLLQDLTKKGLEKFGQTIELSYANIQKLLLSNITRVGQNITYHLAELRGMARFHYKYGILGLNEDKITAAISANGSFLIKSGEMQQIINNSMLNNKAFFRWLYTAIISLMFETVPPEIPRMTQQDLAYITEFLRNFDEIGADNNTTIGDTKKQGFIMERLGQYLADGPLTILPNMEMNDWDVFLMANECLRENGIVFKHHREMSLVQEFRNLEAAILEIYKEPQSIITTNVKVLKAVDSACGVVNTSMVNTSAGTLLYAFNGKEDGFWLVEIGGDDNFQAFAVFVCISQSGNAGMYSVMDVKFYTENYLSVLLQENTPTRMGVIFQCPVAVLRDKFQPITLDVGICSQTIERFDATEFAQNILKSVAMPTSKFSVSGCRRVSIVLSKNKKKIMLFEMEGEEEEEEDAEMTASTLRESDASMQEPSDAE